MTIEAIEVIQDQLYALEKALEDHEELQTRIRELATPRGVRVADQIITNITLLFEQIIVWARELDQIRRNQPSGRLRLDNTKFTAIINGMLAVANDAQRQIANTRQAIAAQSQGSLSERLQALDVTQAEIDALIRDCAANIAHTMPGNTMPGSNKREEQLAFLVADLGSEDAVVAEFKSRKGQTRDATVG